MEVKFISSINSFQPLQISVAVICYGFKVSWTTEVQRPLTQLLLDAVRIRAIPIGKSWHWDKGIASQ
jgi:hypothetical protein